MTKAAVKLASPGRVMRAAVLEDVGRIVVRHVPCPEPDPHEMLVQVQAVGLCGTDLHIFSGEANYNRDERGAPRPLREHPQILGHEIAGVVERVGARVTGFLPGDRVVLDQGRTCISDDLPEPCEYCLSGDSHQCDRYREHGITGLPGGFAEYVAIPAVNAVRVPDTLAPEHAALTEPLGCVLHAVDRLRRAAARFTLDGDAGRPVRGLLVCGAGPAGLLFVQYLRRVAGYDGLLLVSEPSAAKRALAARFGAETIDPSREDLVDGVRARTGGRGVELVIDAAGAGQLFTQLPGLLRKQGTILLYGHGHAGVDMSVLNQVQFLEPTLAAPVGASGRHEAGAAPLTYQHALDLIASHTIDVDSLVTHRYHSLADVPRAFAGEHRASTYVKGVVVL